MATTETICVLSDLGIMNIPSESNVSGNVKVLLHKDAGVDVEDAIARTLGSCTSLYYELEECLAHNDRDWRKCQNVVKNLKICNDSRVLRKSE